MSSSSEEEDEEIGRKVRRPRPRKRKTIPFTTKLVSLFREEPDLIKWDNGDIVIPEPRLLEKQLARYFRSGHYTSFQRQLNNFGYNKVDKSSGPKNSRYIKVKGEAMGCADDLLKLRPILPPRRKLPPDDSCEEPPEVTSPRGKNGRESDDDDAKLFLDAAKRKTVIDVPPPHPREEHPTRRRRHSRLISSLVRNFLPLPPSISQPAKPPTADESTVMILAPPREVSMPRDGDFTPAPLEPMKQFIPSFSAPRECRFSFESCEMPTRSAELFKKELFISKSENEIMLRISTIQDSCGFCGDLEPLPAPIPPSDDEYEHMYSVIPTDAQRRKRSRASSSTRRFYMASGGKGKRFCYNNNTVQQQSHSKPRFAEHPQYIFHQQPSKLGAHADSLFAAENLGDSIDSSKAAAAAAMFMRESCQSDSVFGIDDINALQTMFVADDCDYDNVLYDADAVQAC